jgi:hypothetical protein
VRKRVRTGEFALAARHRRRPRLLHVAPRR